MYKDNLKLKGFITISLNGKIVREKKNLIVNASLAEISGLVGNTGSKTAFTYLAVGTGTTAAAAGDTTLETEITDSGLERAASTVSQETTTQTDDTLQLLKEWTATGSKAVTEVGALNAGAAGTLLGRQIFSAINVVSTDVLEITYKFVFAGA